MLPAESVYESAAKVSTFSASVVSAVGVNTDVKVILSSVDKLAKAPLGAVMSVLVNPVTASLNVIVTADVSPAFNAVSAISKVSTVLAAVSTA